MQPSSREILQTFLCILTSSPGNGTIYTQRVRVFVRQLYIAISTPPRGIHRKTADNNPNLLPAFFFWSFGAGNPPGVGAPRVPGSSCTSRLVWSPTLLKMTRFPVMIAPGKCQRVEDSRNINTVPEDCKPLCGAGFCRGARRWVASRQGYSGL